MLPTITQICNCVLPNSLWLISTLHHLKSGETGCIPYTITHPWNSSAMPVLGNVCWFEDIFCRFKTDNMLLYADQNETFRDLMLLENMVALFFLDNPGYIDIYRTSQVPILKHHHSIFYITGAQLFFALFVYVTCISSFIYHKFFIYLAIWFKIASIGLRL